MRSFSMPTRLSNSWSSEDIQLLRQLAVSGLSLETIAVKLRRTPSAVRNKATMHGISLSGPGGTRLQQQRNRWIS
jgi:hypothetical protein